VATPAAVGVAVEAANSLVTAMAKTVTILIILMIRMQLARPRSLKIRIGLQWLSKI
jgi:hypothetical protein